MVQDCFMGEGWVDVVFEGSMRSARIWLVGVNAFLQLSELLGCSGDRRLLEMYFYNHDGSGNILEKDKMEN